MYNGEAFLEQTILSVINQDYANIEYIIIDGGSSDRSVDIIKKFEHKIDYWVSEKDNGIYDAWNKGLSQANGDIIGFVNADDWYESGIFNDVVTNYLAVKNKFIYFGRMKLRSFDGDTLYTKNSDFKLLKSRMSINHPTVFISKDIYNLRGFDNKFKICGDYEFFLFVSGLPDLNTISTDLIVTNMRIGGVSDNFKSTLKVIREDYLARRIHLTISEVAYFLFKDLTIKLPKKTIKFALSKLGLEKYINGYYSKKKF